MGKNNFSITLLKVPMDLIMILASFWLAFGLRGVIAPFFMEVPMWDYMKMIIATLPLWLFFFTLSGLYIQKSNSDPAEEIKKIALGVSASLASVLILGYAFPNRYLDFNIPDPIFPAKLIPFFGWGLAILLVFLGRILLWRAQKFLSQKVNILIVGSHQTAIKILSELQKSSTNYRIVGVVGAGKISSVKTYKNWEKFTANHTSKVIDEIIIDHTLPTPNKLAIKRFADKNFWSVKIIPESIELTNSRITMSAMGSIPLIELHRTPLFGWGLFYKRIFDLIISILLLIVLSPVFLLIALAIKISARDKVIFAHSRVGAHGKIFQVFKFSTMIKNADKELKHALKNPLLKKEWDTYYKLKNDPRITPIGKLLRKTSLDELPQLLNVLKGDMSLVGPRPVKLEELEKYGDEQEIFLSLRPGITGLWQVSGRSDTSYKERIDLDIYYVENWSPILDIVILARTLPALKKGAY